MATNDFIGFASNGSANVMSQADYAAAIEQGNGVQPGMASSKLANKAWRQGANMAAALGRIAAARGYDALDNGDLNALQSSIDDAVSVGTFDKMFFSQTSGRYTAPRTGVYRVTLKGGGGGGAGRNSAIYATGGGGGEGGTLVFYIKLIKGQSYNYIIGAGGAAGTNDDAVSNGGNGGSTYFMDDYSVKGGTGGYYDYFINNGGTGGNAASTPAGIVCHLIPGQTGECGCRGANMWQKSQTTGGGYCNLVTKSSNYGGGGGGAGGRANFTYDAFAGGNGYILIEYADS